MKTTKSISERQEPMVRTKLVDFDKAGLLGLVHDLCGLKKAVAGVRQLRDGQRDTFLARLDRIRKIGHNLSYGVGDDMDSLLHKRMSS